MDWRRPTQKNRRGCRSILHGGDLSMKHDLAVRVGAVVLLAGVTAGCDKMGLDKLGLGQKAPESTEAPGEQQLQKIRYMSSAASGTDGRKLYSHYEEAKNCGDFELAMRWNRPPDIEGGPFHKKLVYLTSGIPADLPKDSEVFITARIGKGETLPSGAAGWSLRMKDGTMAQAIEASDYWEKEEQTSQEGKLVALVAPNKPGRAFCGQAVYQGMVGKDATVEDQKIPLFAVLFAMDRDK
jgi:hypothetical protein